MSTQTHLSNSPDAELWQFRLTASMALSEYARERLLRLLTNPERGGAIRRRGGPLGRRPDPVAAPMICNTRLSKIFQRVQAIPRTAEA